MNYIYLPATKLKEILKEKLNSIRTGRVNSTILDAILVDAYSSKMHINEIATITSPEAGQLLITPFDKSILSSIEKAITLSTLGVNPVNDGAGIRLVFPPLTEENRKARIKDISLYLEESKIAMRNSRQDILKKIKRQKEEGELSEDMAKREETKLQLEVDALILEFEEMTKAKEAELMKL